MPCSQLLLFTLADLLVHWNYVDLGLRGVAVEFLKTFFGQVRP